MKQKISYKDAGVDIEKADQAIDSSKKEIQQTFTENVISTIGGFGSMYNLKNILKNYNEPIMVQSIDGVGTKMSVAQHCEDFRSIGTDLVSACCNDVAATGAKPLTFLDYIASDSLNPKTISEIIKSVAVECKKLGVSLVGGETAEMPGTYRKTEYDLVGVATGIIDKKNIIDGSKIKNGDAVLGLPSNGLHTNGYSLVRHIFGLDNDSAPLDIYYDDLGETLAESLLKPHLPYYHQLKNIFGLVKGIAHITGGGLYENMPRMMPGGVTAKFSRSLWAVPPIFNVIQEEGKVDLEEMYHVFNMGLGMVVAVGENRVTDVLNLVKNSVVVGEIIKSSQNEEVLIQD